ncbi:MAG: DUF2252 domain-containing protein [Acidobacteriaceae bacterium]
MTMSLSSKERFALGQMHRKQMRRAEHGIWKAKERREDPLRLVQQSMHGRIPALVALKYERMEASPFGFFRGAVPLMAYDFSLATNTGILTQLCGDAHVRNLGAYAGSDGRLLFDINDFDETIAGPFEWDVKRMATSLVLAGRETGTNDGNCREAAEVFLDRYRRDMREFARMPVLEVARFQVHRLRNVPAVERILEIAQRAAPADTLKALTEVNARAKERKNRAKDHGQEPKTPESLPSRPPRIFQSTPPILKRLTGAEAERIVRSLGKYAESLSPERKKFFSQYRPIDVAFKVVGTGSVGLRDYCIYMDGNGPKDPLFLQIKEEAASAYAPYVQHLNGRAIRRCRDHQGRRVVEGERLMQLQSDPFLGWTALDGRDYMVRQLNDHKASVQLDDLKQAGLVEYARVCGDLLARGHARAGDSSILSGYLGVSGRFDAAVADFAVAYADQTERDWRALARSRKSK